MSQQPPSAPQGPSEPTQPMPPAVAGAAQGPPPGGPGQPAPVGFGAPPPSRWQRATTTSGGRWALAAVAGVVALILLAVVGVSGYLIGQHTASGDNQRGSRVGQRGGLNGSRGGQGNGQGRRQLMPGMPGGRLPALPGAGAAHGEYTLQGRTVLFQSGQVTAVSSTSITVRSSDGFTQTYTITSQTRVRRTQLGALRAGDTVLVVADSTTRDATLLTGVGTQVSGTTS